MLPLNLIRNNKESVIERLKIKNFEAKDIVAKIIEIDSYKRELQQQIDSRQSKLNTISKEIGNLYKQGKQQEAEKQKNESILIKEDIKKLNETFAEKGKELEHTLLQLPNLPNEAVPRGYDADQNVYYENVGEVPELNKDCLPHWELAEKYRIIDFTLGNKLTGSGFPVYMGKGAKLQRALIQFFLDEGEKAGYKEILPPVLVNEDSAYSTGQLPDKEGQMYQLKDDVFYLIPTAEVPVTNIFRDVILNENDFPVKLMAYTPCFRREAGSYGKDVRGLNRLHQFDKVEIVQVQHPEKSYATLDEMTRHVESLLEKLNLYYRKVLLCGGDISFTSALTYDFEVYSAAQDKWLEVSSVSNFESFQANRLKLRFKGSNKKPVLAHTLNGSALALPRIVAALLENNQTSKGIVIPEILRKYTGFDIID